MSHTRRNYPFLGIAQFGKYQYLCGRNTKNNVTKVNNKRFKLKVSW